MLFKELDSDEFSHAPCLDLLWRPAQNQNPPVVAIGASAGGLAAFQQVVENLPSDTGMAFVLLSHILRTSPGLLPEILSRSTKMVVIEVKVERQKIFANHIYVLPPGKFMEIKGDYLLLIPRPDLPVNNAINHFLFSLAQDQAPSSTGIILSGEGSDGAEGLKILKEKGGATIAQAPDTAASKSMPIHAIEIGHVDNVLSPKGIATWLGLRRGLYRQGAVQSQGEEGKPRDRCRGDLDNSVHLVQSLANSYNK